jgi:hypothetical protein
MFFPCSDLVWTDLCHRVATSFNILTTLSHHVLQTTCALVQTGLLVTQCFFFFSLLGLTISPTKSEVVLFSRRHLWPPVSIRIGGRLLPETVSFKYMEVYFETELRWGIQARYVHKRCLQRQIFLKSVTDV